MVTLLYVIRYLGTQQTTIKVIGSIKSQTLENYYNSIDLYIMST